LSEHKIKIDEDEDITEKDIDIRRKITEGVIDIVEKIPEAYLAVLSTEGGGKVNALVHDLECGDVQVYFVFADANLSGKIHCGEVVATYQKLVN